MGTDSESTDSESTDFEMPDELAQLLECLEINSDEHFDGFQ